MNRLFTFGCSFTNYVWPTWADILGREFDRFENWALNGAGNCLQLYSLIECHKRNQINKDDTVIIMWTSVDREDRWKDGQWSCDGDISNKEYPYDQKYIDKFADTTGSLIRDLAVISIVRKVLESYGCQWYFLSVHSFEQKYNKEIFNLYQDDLEFIKPSVDEIILEKKHDVLINEDKSWVESVKNKISKWKNNSTKFELHPTPIEYLEYLDIVLPEIKISDNTRNWVTKENKLEVKLNKNCNNKPKERF